jgi:hypothetical protein
MRDRSLSAVSADALFVSALQRSEGPSTGEVWRAIATAIRAFGSRGCAEQVAQEFGDHPDVAVPRMRWARRTADEAFGSSGHSLARGRQTGQRFLAQSGHAA